MEQRVEDSWKENPSAVFQRAVSLAHKAFEISWITECWQYAFTLFLAATSSLFQGTGLQQLLLDKAVLVLTLHALNKKRLDLGEKLLCKNCIGIYRGACMWMKSFT